MNVTTTKLRGLALLGGVWLLAGCGGSGGTGSTTTTTSGTGGSGTTTTTTTTSSTAPWKPTKVFMILLENRNWQDVVGSASAPYINSLLTMGAHAEQYFNAPLVHPSEPNYLWLEAGENFGILNDNEPSSNSQSTTAHLVTQLEKAGKTWKSYQEDIPGTDCPLTSVMNYAPKHNPMVFFEDVTDKNSATSQHCISHVRPYTELANDLTSDTVADYNFLTPNLCNDGHNACPPLNDQIKQADAWLSTEVPKILASKAYTDGAVLFITWDESELGDHPIGMIVLSKDAKVGYSNTIKYTHSSTLRTVQEIFGLSPFLGDAANATDLADMFSTLP